MSDIEINYDLAQSNVAIVILQLEAVINKYSSRKGSMKYKLKSYDDLPYDERAYLKRKIKKYGEEKKQYVKMVKLLEEACNVIPDLD